MTEPCLIRGDPTPSRHWRRARRSKFLLATGLIFLLGLVWLVMRGWYVVGIAWCACYTAPPSTLVFDDDPTTAAALMGTGRYGAVGVIEWGPSWPGPRRHPPRRGPPRQPAAGREVFALGFDVPGSTGTLFMHARRLPGGGSRLVRVAADCLDQTVGGYDLWVDAEIYRFPALLGLGSEDCEHATWVMWVPDGQRLRIYAGQPDPADASHFTIAYELGGVPGTLDGRLKTDGYQGIDLQVRDGPATIELPRSPQPTTAGGR